MAYLEENVRNCYGKTHLIKEGAKHYLEDFKQKARLLSPLTLAFIGDAVYECETREYVLNQLGDLSPAKLHQHCSYIVRASGQAHTMKYLMHHLEEDEEQIYKRGRNANSHTVPKNADITEYRMATGLEALVGFLHLSKQQTRLQQIFEMIQKNTWEELLNGKNNT